MVLVDLSEVLIMYKNDETKANFAAKQYDCKSNSISLKIIVVDKLILV